MMLYAGVGGVAFVDTLITAAESRVACVGTSVDLTRVSAIGTSSGRMMVYRLAAEPSSRFAALVCRRPR